MFYREEEFEDITQMVILVNYSPGYKLGDFNCGVKDYNDSQPDKLSGRRLRGHLREFYFMVMFGSRKGDDYQMNGTKRYFTLFRSILPSR